ncbi:MAG: hypothetical protein ACK5LV_06990 [Lachnospirales bacterium]
MNNSVITYVCYVLLLLVVFIAYSTFKKNKKNMDIIAENLEENLERNLRQNLRENKFTATNSFVKSENFVSNKQFMFVDKHTKRLAFYDANSYNYKCSYVDFNDIRSCEIVEESEKIMSQYVDRIILRVNLSNVFSNSSCIETVILNTSVTSTSEMYREAMEYAIKCKTVIDDIIN